MDLDTIVALIHDPANARVFEIIELSLVGYVYLHSGGDAGDRQRVWAKARLLDWGLSGQVLPQHEVSCVKGASA